MIRLPMIVPLTAILSTLAACNLAPSVSATNASGTEVAAKVAAAGAGGQFVSPGRWEGAMTINEMAIPGLPPAAAEQMKAHIGQGRTFATCLTPAQAKSPGGKFFANDPTCRYDRFTMGGGRIDAAMTCTQGTAKRTMAMTGTYAPDAYTMTMASKGNGQGPEGMAMKMTVTAKRAGACTGKETDA